MGDFIRTVHAYPWTTFWTWIAFLFTIMIIAVQFRDNVFRFHIYHTRLQDENPKLDKETRG